MKTIGGLLLILGVIGISTGIGSGVTSVNIFHLIAGAVFLTIPARFAHKNSVFVIIGIFYGLLAMVGFWNEPQASKGIGFNPQDPWLCMALAAAGVFLGSHHPGAKQEQSLEQL